MPEMDAPRALVSRLLVNGNEALKTRLIEINIESGVESSI